MPSDTPIIRLRGVDRVYRSGAVEVRALRSVDLDIQPGEFVAIMGASGSGKSTLMHLLGLLDRPDAGRVELWGRDVARCNDDELARLRNESIGFVFQQFNLLTRTPALTNTLLPLQYARSRPPAQRATDLLAELGLAERAHHTPNELSGGQQQRVAIARALVNDAALVLADEPTGNLDSRSADDIMQVFERLNARGITVILVTHEADIAAHARRVIHMRDGQVVSDERRGPEPAASHIAPRATSGPTPGYALRAFANYFTLGLRALAAHKMRSLLSMLGILIGVAAVVAMLALGAGAREAVQKQFSALGSNLISLRPGVRATAGLRKEGQSRVRLTMEDLAALRRDLPTIRRAAPTVDGGFLVDAGNQNWQSEVLGTTTEYVAMRDAQPILGRFFTEPEITERARVAVLGQTVVRELFDGRNPVGQMIRMKRVPFQVIGVLPEKGNNGWRDRDNVIVVPISTAMYRLTGDDYPEAIDIEVRSAGEIEATQDAVKQLMYRRHRIPESEKDAFYIHNMAEIRQALTATSRNMSWLLAAVAAISMVVGGIGIMNIMLVSVTERVREIGLRMAVGARRRDILGQFLVEAVAVSVTGGLMGMVVGLGVTVAFSQLAGWVVSVSWPAVGMAFFFSAAIGLIFGIWPARRAAMLNPIQALRYE